MPPPNLEDAIVPVLNLRSDVAEADALAERMAGIGRRARRAARRMALASAETKGRGAAPHRRAPARQP